MTLVERLRQASLHHAGFYEDRASWDESGRLMGEAADRIEELTLARLAAINAEKVVLGQVGNKIAALERVVAAAQAEYDSGEYDHGHGGDGEGCRFCGLGDALAAYANTASGETR